MCCISKVKIEIYVFQTLLTKCYKLIHCLSDIWIRRKECWPGIRVTRILSGGFPGHFFHWMPRQWSLQPLRHILQLLAGNTKSSEPRYRTRWRLALRSSASVVAECVHASSGLTLYTHCSFNSITVIYSRWPKTMQQLSFSLIISAGTVNNDLLICLNQLIN